MNQNLKCNNCDSVLISKDNLYFECANCRKDRNSNIKYAYDKNTKIKFMKDDLNISEYYNLYFHRVGFSYHLYFQNGKGRSIYYTRLSKIHEPYRLFTVLYLENRDFNLTRTLPLKEQADKLLNLLLNMAIFI